MAALFPQPRGGVAVISLFQSEEKSPPSVSQVFIVEQSAAQPELLSPPASLETHEKLHFVSTAVQAHSYLLSNASSPYSALSFERLTIALLHWLDRYQTIQSQVQL